MFYCWSLDMMTLKRVNPVRYTFSEGAGEGYILGSFTYAFYAERLIQIHDLRPHDK